MMFLLSGCARQHFLSNISQALRDVEGAGQSAGKNWRSQEEVPLTWQVALKLLKENNLSYRRANERLDELYEDRKKFAWRQLDPRVRPILSLSSSLDDLASLSLRSKSFSVFGTVNLPSPTQIYAERYALELRIYQSEIDLLLLERRLQAVLYSYFLLNQTLTNRVDDGEAFTDDNDSVDGLIAELLREEKTERQQRQREAQLRVQLNTLLNTPGRHWRPQAMSLPRISYENELHKLRPDKGYGLLALRMAAGQVEAGKVRIKQAKLARWPLLSSAVSMPTLYDSRDNRDFDIGDSGLFGSMGKTFDFNNRDARRIEQAQENSYYVWSSLRQRLEREESNLQRLKENYKVLIKSRAMLRREKEWLNQNIPDGRGDLLLNHFESLKKNKDQMTQNSMAIRQLDLQFWIWDEAYWESRQ